MTPSHRSRARHTSRCPPTGLLLLAALGLGGPVACTDDGTDGMGAAGTGGAAGGGAGGTAGGSAGHAGSGGCQPEGVFTLQYRGEGCDGETDLVFVHRDPDGALHARFEGRRPAPSACGPTDTVSYQASVAFDAATCELTVGFDSAWCFSGEGQCAEVEARFQAPAAGASGEGSATLRRCWDGSVGGTPRSCAVSAGRGSSPADCVGVAHGGACAAHGTLCDSGCGSRCVCTAGAWVCTFPPTGESCDGDEACVVQASPNGGFDDLSCHTPVGGEPQLVGSLTLGGTVCPAPPPAPGAFCTAYPRGLRCEYALGGGQVEHCTCEGADGGVDLWACGP